MKRKTKPAAPAPFKTLVIETFQNPTWRVRDLDGFAPTSFNGDVRVRKFRVTVELLEEPTEVIQARIIKLWRECDNSKHWAPIRNAAAEAGLVLDTEERGVDRKVQP